MIFHSKELEKESVLNTAKKMCVAARTAPKAKGVDNIVTAILIENEKEKLANSMETIAKNEEVAFFARDAKGVRESDVVVLIGTKYKTRGVPYCGLCGYENCADNVKNGGICSFDVGDLGIAIGSAVSIAADDRVDNRVMFSAGKTAAEHKILGDDVNLIYAIPLAVKGKNILFDRK